MRLYRYRTAEGAEALGVTVSDGAGFSLGQAGAPGLEEILESSDPVAWLHQLRAGGRPGFDPAQVPLLPPIASQEVWAAGVTYLRSRKARMEESDFSATAYDRVYEAERPELFFKSLAHKTVGPLDPVGIRADARWSVPEPELALVINSRGRVTGYTLGNDMSSRDIEGENLLYLPQAKVYSRSCALGPCVALGVSEAEARTWTISLEIHRHGSVVFAGETLVGNIRRPFADLTDFLFRSQVFDHGAILLTGTGIVPPTDFTLRAGDRVIIRIPALGTLENPVVQV